MPEHDPANKAGHHIDGNMDMPVSAAPNAEASALDKIAAALGLPVSTFSNPAALTAVGSTPELLRLWEATPDGPGRARILAIARQEATRHAGSIAAE